MFKKSWPLKKPPSSQGIKSILLANQKARRMAKLSQLACQGARHKIRLSLLSNQKVLYVIKGLKVTNPERILQSKPSYSEGLTSLPVDKIL